MWIGERRMTLHEYYCEVEDLLDNALNDLTSKDFNNLLVGILSILLDYDEDCDKGEEKVLSN